WWFAQPVGSHVILLSSWDNHGMWFRPGTPLNGQKEGSRSSLLANVPGRLVEEAGVTGLFAFANEVVDGIEVVLGSGTTAEALTVSQLLQVLQTEGDALVAGLVVAIGGHGGTGIAAAVEVVLTDDAGQVLVHDARL